MIINDEQLQYNERWINEFQQLVQHLQRATSEDVHPLILEAEIDGLNYKIKDLTKEVDDYKAATKESLLKKLKDAVELLQGCRIQLRFLHETKCRTDTNENTLNEIETFLNGGNH